MNQCAARAAAPVVDCDLRRKAVAPPFWSGAGLELG